MDFGNRGNEYPDGALSGLASVSPESSSTLDKDGGIQRYSLKCDKLIPDPRPDQINLLLLGFFKPENGPTDRPKKHTKTPTDERFTNPYKLYR